MMMWITYIVYAMVCTLRVLNWYL